VTIGAGFGILSAVWAGFGLTLAGLLLFSIAVPRVPQLVQRENSRDLQIDINLKGTFLMSKFALPGMIAQGKGVIINNSSGWGIVGGDAAVAYCASKGGVVLLTKAMAIDHGRQGIRVNCICPGDVNTPMLPEDARMRGMNWSDYLSGCANRPLGRIGTAGEIAKAALFLASDDSSFVTGTALVVDGGGTAD
jgi:NAD(P)-dependent dehydrogenase (short-subunit alcohol dehydrogenase family)